MEKSYGYLKLSLSTVIAWVAAVSERLVIEDPAASGLAFGLRMKPRPDGETSRVASTSGVLAAIPAVILRQ